MELADVKDDALFKTLASLQAASGKPWGRVLDCGTGSHSLRWIQGLATSGWTAVTADAQLCSNLKTELRLSDAETKQVVVGSWQDKSLLQGEQFDTVIADYLIGALNIHSPYFQDQIFQRLRRHIAPGGRLYVVGMQPLPDTAPGAADIVIEVGRLRDACLMLAGHRPYREYPMDWVERHLRAAGLAVTAARRLPILYSEGSIQRQLDMAARRLSFISDRDVASALERHIGGIQRRMKGICAAVRGGHIQLGFDYIIVAEAAPSSRPPSRPPSRPGLSLPVPPPPAAAAAVAAAAAAAPAGKADAVAASEERRFAPHASSGTMVMAD